MENSSPGHCHKLSKRIADNVKSSRAEVNEDVSNEYFDNLENQIKNIPASNIFNYDKTNITDDPSSKLAITRKERNRVERKAHHSKSLILVYKSKIICREWIHDGPVNNVYSCTKNGWFNGTTFETIEYIRVLFPK